MKKLLLLSATALVAFSCGQKNKAHISGTFSGISKDTIYLEMLTTKGRTVVDSTVTNQQGNYRFTVSTPVAAPTFYNIVYTVLHDFLKRLLCFCQRILIAEGQFAVRPRPQLHRRGLR